MGIFDFLKGSKKEIKRKPKLGGYIPTPKKYGIGFDRSKFGVGGGDIDLQEYSSPRHDQWVTNTCVAQSLVKALEIKRIIEHGREAHVDLSVLDLYYGARDLMSPKMTDWDQGTQIYLGCEVLKLYGVCRDSIFPFDLKNLYIPPPVMATREGRLNRIKSHFRLVSEGSELIDDIIHNLRAENPVVFGTVVGADWIGYRGGKEPLRVERYPEGSHAMVVIGIVNGLFVIENSWSENWGEKGFGYVAPEVFTNSNTQDLWVITNGSENWTEK